MRIDWTPKAEGATGWLPWSAPRPSSRLISEGVTHSRVNLAYAISRAELGQLAGEVPADYKVVNVFDANVRQPAGSSRRRAKEKIARKVQSCRSPKVVVSSWQEKSTLTVEPEKYARDGPRREGSVPDVKAVNVLASRGLSSCQVAAGLRAEATRPPACSRSMPDELPGELASGR